MSPCNGKGRNLKGVRTGHAELFLVIRSTLIVHTSRLRKRVVGSGFCGGVLVVAIGFHTHERRNEKGPFRRPPQL